MPRLRRPIVLVFLVLALLGSACDREPQPAAGTAVAPPPPAPAKAVSETLQLPVALGSIRFAAIGDAGRGDQAQYDVSAQMQAYRRVFPFDFVLMLGDNVYDGGTPEDYKQKFELPYKPLLDAGVKFFATIGNHDDANQPHYAPFNMEGHRYYTFKPPSLVSRVLGGDVRFFMVDTEALDRSQLGWLDSELGKSESEWKIPVFHRPIYTSGRYARPAAILRRALEPILLRHGVSVAFSGHEHFYERTQPQHGITYFISGGAGSLRVGDIHPTDLTAVGFDRDYHFMLVEIEGKSLYYQTITRTGATVDAGVVHRT